jgi:hypothetical protein
MTPSQPAPSDVPAGGQPQTPRIDALALARREVDSALSFLPQEYVIQNIDPFAAMALTFAKLGHAARELATLTRERDEAVAERDAARQAADELAAAPVLIRCIEHINVPQQNKSEITGSECGACIAAHRDALAREVEGLRVQKEAAVEKVEQMFVENEELIRAAVTNGREALKARDERDTALATAAELRKALERFTRYMDNHNCGEVLDEIAVAARNALDESSKG